MHFIRIFIFFLLISFNFFFLAFLIFHFFLWSGWWSRTIGTRRSVEVPSLPSTLLPSDGWTVAQASTTGSCAVGQRPLPLSFHPPRPSVSKVFLFCFFILTLRRQQLLLEAAKPQTLLPRKKARWSQSDALFWQRQFSSASLGSSPFFLVTNYRLLNLPCRAEWPVWQPRDGPLGEIMTAVGFTNEIFFFLPFDIHRYSLQHCCACTQCKREMYIHLRHN